MRNDRDAALTRLATGGILRVTPKSPRVPVIKVYQMAQCETRIVRGRLAYLVLAIRCLYRAVVGER